LLNILSSILFQGYELTTGGFNGKQISSNVTKEEFKEEFGDIVYVYMKLKLKF